VFDGAKLPGKIVNHSRTLRVTRYRVMLESLRSGQSEHVMTEQETKATEIRYLKQCTMVKEDMTLAVIDELERAGLKWRRAPYEADAELAHLMQPGSDALPGVSLYSAVISADLDLVVHGAAALLTSYDVKNDSAFVYELDRFRSYELVDGSNPFMEAVARKLKEPQWTVKEVLSDIRMPRGVRLCQKCQGYRPRARLQNLRNSSGSWSICSVHCSAEL